MRGEAGVGKSALLSHLLESVSSGWYVATAVGVESEMELAYSGLHQLCGPMLDRLDRLPTPQREALATVFGQSTGAAPDRFLVGLAALTLFAEIAEEQPLVCIIDDAQWLDRASAQILGFVARRLLAERIALVCATRTRPWRRSPSPGCLSYLSTGLGDSDARALLLENVYGPLDAAVCDQIVTESHGNPLALLELPRSWRRWQTSPVGSGCPTANQWSARSNRATSGASAYFLRRRNCSSSPRPQSRSVTLCCSTVPPRRSGLTWLRPTRPWTRVCSK